LCGWHNRFKTRGYTTHRDQHGHWHHYRPDGTEIGWRADLQTTLTLADLGWDLERLTLADLHV
jgi:hypothetical protein